MVPTVDFPIWYTFDPEDEELIEHYLGPKVRGEQKFHLSVIPELDVYASEPWNLGIELRHGRNRDAFFCFTRVTRSGASNGRLLRCAGNGTWHASGQRTLIRCNGAVTGKKMTNLKFLLRAKKGDKPVATSWIMHEYRLLDPPIDDQGKEMVLYRIQKSGTGLSDDRQLSCLDDYPANQQLRKRKRDQMHCCEIAAETTMSCSTPAPPPYIASDEQPENTSVSVWEDSMNISKQSIIQSQPMMQLPSSGDDAALLMTTMTSCCTPPPCIIGDEQLESVRTDDATSTGTPIWEDLLDISEGSAIQSQPMRQPLCFDDENAWLPDWINVESAIGSRNTSTSLAESDWDEADFRKILEMVKDMVS